MIPGPFQYHRPTTVAEAAQLLATLGDDARLLAGGQSLIPMMKLRLATPQHLVDLHGIGALKGVQRVGDRLVIGAMTTQHELLASSEAGKVLPILHEAARLITEPQVRYRGTVGGNVANGDPGNDLPALMMALGASYSLEGPAGTREIPAAEFYQGAYFTALEAGEILMSVSVPVPAAGYGYAYEKLKRKVGDYATAAAAVTFNRWHARRAIRSRTCVMIVSDGYETGDAALLGREMAALARRCRRIVWLNPMMAWEGYVPEAAGIRAALPHVDLHAPANTLRSLLALESYLARL